MTAHDDGSLRVTLRDVYELVGELKDVVGELKADISRQADREDAASEVRKDHEQRMRALERKVWSYPTLSGVIAVISVALSVLQWHGK